MPNFSSLNMLAMASFHESRELKIRILLSRFPTNSVKLVSWRKKIYDRVSPHPFVLQCYGDGESTLGKGLVLLYLPAGTLKTNLDLKNFPVERTQ
jgi:hypothetical protein